jgi:hypothetical protein
MRVIQERKPFETWTIKIECDGLNWRQNDKVSCGSILELNKDDILKREWFKYPDDSGINYGFICPICGCFTQIDDDMLPEGIKTKAKDYLIVVKENER